MGNGMEGGGWAAGAFGAGECGYRWVSRRGVIVGCGGADLGLDLYTVSLACSGCWRAGSVFLVNRNIDAADR